MVCLSIVLYVHVEQIGQINVVGLPATATRSYGGGN